MKTNSVRSERWTRVTGPATACAWLAVLGAAVPAHAQCIEKQLFASDGAPLTYYGTSAAIDGDTAVVGNLDDNTPAGTDAGSVYVYVRAGGVWAQQAHLFASDGAASDFFGNAVAISGDTLVVAAYGDNTAGGSNAGSAYVYVRSGTTWTQQARLFASDGAANDEFGAVAISGDTIIVGAIRDDTPAGVNAGSAYVYVRSGTVWTQQAHLFASDGAAGDLFGNWVALEDETAVVGAQWDDTPGGLDAGSAYVFVRSGAFWTEQGHLVASDGAAGDNFGYGVEISGDTAAVGAILDDTAGGIDAGSAYVYARNAGVWTEQAHLIASDAAADDRFSSDIALLGDTAIIGATRDDTPDGVNAGSAYVFVRSGSSWTEQDQFFAPDGKADDRFGYCVEISGDTLIVGAWGDDTPAGTDAGSAYIFQLGCIPGDLNCDDLVNLADLDGFALALVDPAAYLLAYPTCDAARADVNQDGLINGRDTQTFVAMLLAP